MDKFKLRSPYSPAGDQPKAIAQLVDVLNMISAKELSKKLHMISFIPLWFVLK